MNSDKWIKASQRLSLDLGHLVAFILLKDNTKECSPEYLIFLGFTV